MSERQRIGAGAYLVGYAMSRLDVRAVELLGADTWDDAFARAAEALGEKPTSVKALRDEFDPFFPNRRRGWDRREPRPPITALLHELQAVTDEELAVLVRDALDGGRTALAAVEEVVDTPPERMAGVAERLMTGDFAEEYFLDHAERLVGVPRGDLHDARREAGGFDFAVPDGRLVEVKGLRRAAGDLLFTDLEWRTARREGGRYLLVVVARIPDAPDAAVVADPAARLAARARLERRLVPTWTARYAP